MKDDIELIKKSIRLAKENEKTFYSKLILPVEAKEQIFHLKSKPIRMKPKIVVWDPEKGNLIMTEEEFRKKYEMDKN